MAKEKILYSFVDVDDSVSIQKLSILDQLRALLRSLTKDDKQELANDDIVTQEYLTRKANLSDFLYKATAPIRSGRRQEVIVNISTEFSPVFREVITSPSIADFYVVSTVQPKLEYNIPHDFMVKLSVKEK